LRLDGGSMFGVVPRVLWSKLAAIDDRNRIELAHNCLLLTHVGQPIIKVLIETGSGNKFDSKTRDIFGLSDYAVHDALREVQVEAIQISQVIVSHLHFDHAGGVTRRSDDGVSITFPNAPIYVQKREWDDANANNSVMTRTYLRENLDPIRDRVKLIESSPPYPIGHVPQKDESPHSRAIDRLTEILPGIFSLLVPGHTWGQQAILFTDDNNRTVVFTPDVMPTANHLGAAYNMAYDVEPYVSTNTRRWFLQAAVENNWTLVLDHEPGNPVRKVEPEASGWFKLINT